MNTRTGNIKCSIVIRKNRKYHRTGYNTQQHEDVNMSHQTSTSFVKTNKYSKCKM